jgi:phosphoglycerate dehydrogenase-like enzyme
VSDVRVAVCSRSFSQNPVLRAELLARYDQVTFNDAGLRLGGQSLVDFLRGHQKAITALETVDDFVISKLPELEVISKYGVGLDTIDIASVRTHGKRLGWTGGVNRRSVAELVIAFAIDLLRHVVPANREVLSGTWRQHVGGQLSGRTVGIIGCGHVGKEVVTLLQPFGCTVLVHDIRDYPDFFAAHRIETQPLDALLARSDVVTLHVPLDDSTRGMLDARRLRLMRPASIFINTARGGIVDEDALHAVLASGGIAGAALDVLAVEPPSDHPLLSLPNVLVTPHIGGSSAEAILAMGRAAIAGLEQNAIPSE